MPVRSFGAVTAARKLSLSVKMKFTVAQIEEFHRTLHQECGLDALRLTHNDQRAWFDFLREMEPLEDHPLGPFCVEDIRGAVGEMHYQKREGKASWAIRPSTILRNPDSFRDLVLEARKRRKQPKKLTAKILKTEKQPSVPSDPLPENFSIKEEFEKLQREGGAL